MRRIVAVSGGVDSVVLLNMLANASEDELIVAHFDHGIRDDSAADARFVAALAKHYGLTFESERVELGPSSSEEQARTYRYSFLRKLAARYQASIVTAHHRDDVIETIAINLLRGTGWRGLAVMNDPTIERPLLAYKKRDLYDYATAHNLEWVEDETNGADTYLRNRIRRKLARLDQPVQDQLLELYSDQVRLRRLIDDEAERLATSSRHFLTMIDEACALELLRKWTEDNGLSLTRPQRRRLLHAVKSARPGDVMEPGGGATLTFTKRDLIVKHPL